MKKIFLAALMAMSLCSYSYAQDDDDEYEEDSPRAVAEAPAPAKSSAPARVSSSSSEEGGSGFMGVNLELVSLLSDLHRVGLVFKLAENMELTAIFGINIIGDTDGEDAGGNKIDNDDGYTQVALGAGFDIFFQSLLPISVGGDIVFTHWGEDNNQIDISPMFGARAEIIKNFCINGKVGFDIEYHWWAQGNNDMNRLSLGLATRLNFIWFFM